MKNLSIYDADETNLELKVMSYLFCLLSWETCLWSLFVSTIDYGFIVNYDFWDLRWIELNLRLLSWVMIFYNFYFEFYCPISVAKVGIDS